MQVQAIEANQTTNNCRKPCFKAKFIEDYNGYIHTACNKANVTKNLKKNIKTFSELFPQTQLEILDVLKNEITSGYMYYIYNHATGKAQYMGLQYDIKHKNALDKLLSKLIIKMKNENDFFCLSIRGDFIEGFKIKK